MRRCDGGHKLVINNMSTNWRQIVEPQTTSPEVISGSPEVKY